MTDAERFVTGESNARDVLEEELRFYKLLAEISARFVNVPASEVDLQIENALRNICEFHQIDHSSLWQGTPDDPDVLLLTHLFRDPGLRRPTRLKGSESFPWAQARLVRKEIICVPDVEDLPPEAAIDQATWRDYSVKSALGIPLMIGGGPVFGVLSFDATSKARDWPEPLRQSLQHVARMFASALDRKRAEQTLQDSEARLSLAAASANAGLWTLEPENGRIWATDKAKELFGLSPSDDLTLASFLALVHPDDRERISQTIDHGMGTGEEVAADYRACLPDGSLRWISSRGRRQSGRLGEPDHLMGVSVDITEITRSRERLRAEGEYLKSEIEVTGRFSEIVGQSKALRKVLERIERVAPTDSSVLITGETGTGKELVARAIHNLSSRKDRIMVKVDCSALSASIIESELFGREKGAYTGALTSQVGRFEFANKSTIFLDEIGELPLELQTKLLRVLEDGQLVRLGNPKLVKLDVRVIVATNRDLAQRVKQGMFREDLYYRLNVFPIHVPPLRERAEDIPPLVWSFVREFERKMGRQIESIPKNTMETLQRHAWPGNIRELRHLIEQAVILTTGGHLTVDMPASSGSGLVSSFEEIEKQHILSVLDQTRWRVKGLGGAAEMLNTSPTTLYTKMKRLGIPSRQDKYGPPY